MLLTLASQAELGAVASKITYTGQSLSLTALPPRGMEHVPQHSMGKTILAGHDDQMVNMTEQK
eukprot:CAMPEP_0197890396 /NCGR_PEP_ID=MMETSP1439-20131203/26496_1 /TAXON_ID=66791 /ORGANISM="Gonyaulax spinifera, Strain CCMP409" /LENGTH=62 /DNA_ID=CAMNT_0043510425 /DNA_START=27 /DNA_END=212 /DNA_ORIENTATION=+